MCSSCGNAPIGPVASRRSAPTAAPGVGVRPPALQDKAHATTATAETDAGQLWRSVTDPALVAVPVAGSAALTSPPPAKMLAGTATAVPVGNVRRETRRSSPWIGYVICRPWIANDRCRYSTADRASPDNPTDARNLTRADGCTAATLDVRRRTGCCRPQYQANVAVAQTVGSQGIGCRARAGTHPAATVSATSETDSWRGGHSSRESN